MLIAELKDIPHKKAVIRGTNNIRISFPTGEEYCKVKKIFDTMKIIEWYTYENKQTRELRVMTRGKQPKTNVEDIKRDLTTQGFNVVEVIQKYKVDRNKDNKILFFNLRRINYED